IVQPYTSRKDLAGRMHLPETEARMMRILLEQRVGLPGLLADLLGQGPVQHEELRQQERIHSSFTSSFLARPARASASASSAIRERSSADSGRANSSSHRCSDSISWRMIEAIAS